MHENPPVRNVYELWIAQETIEHMRTDIELIRAQLFWQYRQRGLLHRLEDTRVTCAYHRGLRELFFIIWEGRTVLSVRSHLHATQPWLDSFPCGRWVITEAGQFDTVMVGNMKDYMPVASPYES